MRRDMRGGSIKDSSQRARGGELEVEMFMEAIESSCFSFAFQFKKLLCFYLQSKLLIFLKLSDLYI